MAENPVTPFIHQSHFTFIDLFAGIGGLRKGFDAIGGHCVFTSEWDKYAQQTYAAKHKAKGNGFGYAMVTKDDVARTLSARYYKDGSEILVSRGKGKNPRRLTPRECARLMGYGDDFKIPVSDTQAYKQFGNSVAVPVFQEVARIMQPHIAELVNGASIKRSNRGRSNVEVAGLIRPGSTHRAGLA